MIDPARLPPPPQKPPADPSRVFGPTVIDVPQKDWQARLFVCERCGAIAMNRQIHADWHERTG